MLTLSTLVFLISISHAQCSRVIEAASQKGIYVSEYCPKMKYCAEGTHVMCMYYEPGRIMGPRCTKPKNVSVTPELANKFLEISNAVRSKIARGKEKGKGGEQFPKGYGMFRLKWDSELATFAQVLANQCMLRHDMCRATSRFPDPGQTAGLVRFSYPDWIPITKNIGLDRPGLTMQKMEYAIKQSIKSWYQQKAHVDSAMIASAPNWSDHPSQQEGRLYMEMIYGPATHMGCGMSAYSDYGYYDRGSSTNYNVIQIICNFSARSRPGGPVYETSPPTQVGFTIKCGCPVGMDEDADCLCYESPRNAITSSPFAETCTKRNNCKPSVVLLPIFTVENASPKTPARSGNEDKKESDVEIMDLYQTTSGINSVYHPMAPMTPVMAPPAIAAHAMTPPRIGVMAPLRVRSSLTAPLPREPLSPPSRGMPNYQHNLLTNVVNDIPANMMRSFGGNSITSIRDKPLPMIDPIYSGHYVSQGAGMLPQEPRGSVIGDLIKEVHQIVNYQRYTTPNPHIMYDVNNRYFDNRIIEPSHYNPKAMHSPPKYGYSPPKKKESLFAKVPTFDLTKKVDTLVKPGHDVQPRKDFSKIKSLVKSYLDMRRHRMQSKTNKELPKSSVDFLQLLKDHTTEPYTQLQDSTEEKLMSYNSISNNKLETKSNKPYKNEFDDIESDASKEKSNDKLMSLLDKLEQEVKHIALDKSKKEIFDAKIRKIYGTVVENTELSSHKYGEPGNSDAEYLNNEKYKSDHFRISHLEADSISKPTQDHFKDGYESDKNYDVDRPREHTNHDDTQNEIRPITRNQNDISEGFGKRYNGHQTHIHKGYSDTDDVKHRTSYNEKEALISKHMYTEAEEKKKIKDAEKRKHNMVVIDREEDPLSIDRRKYYQDKLDNIVRKVQNTRKFKHHSEIAPLLRPIIRPSIGEDSHRTGKTLADPFYMPDRARFLHGF